MHSVGTGTELLSISRRIGDIWVSRMVRRTDELAAARAAVAHLKPIVAVTGGSRGIGKAIALRFAEKGHDVALIARNAAELEAAAREITAKTGRTALVVVRDVAETGAPEAIAADLAAHGAYVDVLVNNAAIGLSGPFTTQTPGEIDRLAALNVAAPTRLIRHFLPPMQARAQGGILNVASLGGVVPGPGQAAYYASKAYVLSLSEAVAAEVSGQGVRVTLCAPGPVNTGFHSAMGAEGAPYRILVPPLSPGRVARAAYRGFAFGQRLVVPGLLNRAIYGLLRLLPHAITAPIMALLLSSTKE